MKQWRRPAAVLCMTALLLSGCQRVSKEQLAYRESGIAFLEQGDYAGALDQFEKALAESSRVADFETDVLKYRAETEYQLGDYEAAAHTYDLLNQLDVKRPEYDYYWAMCLAKSGNPEQAEEKLMEGRKLETSERPKNTDETKDAPGYAAALTAVADAWLAEQNAEKADALYSQLIAGGLADSRLYNRLAKACMEQQDYDKALGYIEQGLALADDLARKDLKFNQAVCYEYLGDFQGALELFKNYASEYGSDDAVEHEIAFLVTR